MDEDDVLLSLLVLKLTDRFEKRLTLDIPDCASDLDNGNFGTFSGGIPVKLAFDLVRNMRNDLYGTAAEVAAALFLEYGPVDLSGRDVGVFLSDSRL